MKILLIKKEDAIPFLVTKKHLEKIKSVDRNIKIHAVSSNNKVEIEKHLKDSDVIAGIEPDIPPIKNAKNLKLIHVFSAGVSYVLTKDVVKSSVLVTNSAGFNAIPVAEHALGLILNFTRKFYDTFQKQQKKIWKKNQYVTELNGKIVLVVGLGHIGSEIARLASSFGAKVIAVKQNINNKPVFVNKLFKIDQLEQVLPKADFVVLSLPLTPKTRHLFDMKKFKLMKKSAVLINIGRGGVVNEKELILSLKKKIIAGAGLDVTEEEPLSKDNPLWDMENVIITPHHAGWSEKFMDRGIDIFCLNLKAYLKNKPLPNLVDKKRGY